MDIAEAGALVRRILERRYEGQFGEVNDYEPLWWLHRGAALCTFYVLPDTQRGTAMLTINCGLAAATPLNVQTLRTCDEENAGLLFGRVFTRAWADGEKCSVLLQEIVPFEYLTPDNVPFIQTVVATIDWVTGYAEFSAARITTALGGRPFDPSEAELLAVMA